MILVNACAIRRRHWHRVIVIVVNVTAFESISYSYFCVHHSRNYRNNDNGKYAHERQPKI